MFEQAQVKNFDTEKHCIKLLVPMEMRIEVR